MATEDIIGHIVFLEPGELALRQMASLEQAGSGSGGHHATSLGGGAAHPVSGSGHFAQKAGSIRERLKKDLGLSDAQAAGLLGNLGYESAGFKELQEGHPIAGRGGFGWGQWTGARRQQFEGWSKAHNLNPASDEANYGFLKHELQGKQSGFLKRLKTTRTVEEATALTELEYEAPAHPRSSFAGRLSYAEAAEKSAAAGR
jgi:hypothetical protein